MIDLEAVAAGRRDEADLARAWAPPAAVAAMEAALAEVSCVFFLLDMT